ncbi:MAG: hypothetical protein LUQ65_09470 [Candidatus Helarchaeota archaeon]|nr:hypothetical protein [Candidatus Helarchaeota archaeon]
MPNFPQLITERTNNPNLQITNIQRLIGEIEDQITHRPMIVYAADITKTHPNSPNSIYPLDKTVFADLVDSVGDSENIDVLIQSPGGFADSTEQLVNILRNRFRNVHFYIPHTAKSAATMMVCSGNKIFMDHRSELGPIDPQINIPKAGGVMINVPAQAYLDGFDKVREVVDKEGKLSAAFIPVLSQVDVATIQMCHNASEHSKQLVKNWLRDYMFQGKPDAEERANRIGDDLGDYRAYLSHGRPLGIQRAVELGLEVTNLADLPQLQAKIWELYSRIELSYDGSPIVKLFMSKNFQVFKKIPATVELIPSPSMQRPQPQIPKVPGGQQPSKRSRHGR